MQQSKGITAAGEDHERDLENPASCEEVHQDAYTAVKCFGAPVCTILLRIFEAPTMSEQDTSPITIQDQASQQHQN